MWKTEKIITVDWKVNDWYCDCMPMYNKL